MTAQAAEGRAQDLESLRLLLEQVYGLTGYDFRDYAVPAIRRRVTEALAAEGCATIDELREQSLAEPRVLERLIDHLAMRNGEFFRDPALFGALIRDAVPLLRTYPSVRVWHVGCGSGEESYSLAVVLREGGLLERSRIYATDLSSASLRQARDGAYPIASLNGAADRYTEAGGRGRLSDYFTVNGPLVHLSRQLKDRIVFMEHSLATDGSLNEFHLVVCRDLIPQFNRALQQRVYGLIDASLCPLGLLALGRQHTLRSSPLGLKLRPLGESGCLYRLAP